MCNKETSNINGTNDQALRTHTPAPLHEPARQRSLVVAVRGLPFFVVLQENVVASFLLDTAMLPSPDAGIFCCMKRLHASLATSAQAMLPGLPHLFCLAHARGNLPSDSRCGMQRCTQPAAILRGERARKPCDICPGHAAWAAAFFANQVVRLIDHDGNFVDEELGEFCSRRCAPSTSTIWCGEGRLLLWHRSPRGKQI